MDGLKAVFTIALSTAMFIGMGLGCIKLLDISDAQGSILICLFLGLAGLMVGIGAMLTELEYKALEKFTPRKKKNLNNKTDEAYAAPEKE